MSAAIQLKNLQKTFPGGVRAVAPVTLNVEAGEQLAIVGPSGSGKSTLLRLIAGLEPPSGGEIWISGRRADGLPPASRDIAMVFQTPALYPHLNVFANLAFGLKARRVPSSEIRSRIDEVATRLGLSDVLARRPHTLSGGQRQRVALGRAFARRPAVLLLDEPFSALDAPLRADLRTALAELHRAYRPTLLHVTHDQAEAMALGDRLALFDLGQLQALGTPQALYDHPPSRFVGTFLGSPPMNLVPVSILDRGETVLLSTDAGPALDLPRSLVPQPGSLLLGIRPESLHLGAPADPSSHLTIHAHLERLERLGHESTAILRLNSLRLLARLPAHSPLPTGDSVPVSLDLSQASWFDPQTGHRIAFPS